MSLTADHYHVGPHSPTAMLNQAATLNDTHRWRSLVLVQSFRLTKRAGSSHANNIQGSSDVRRTCAIAAHFGATYS
eukprot:1106343-Heterocapsa_arctica.AAC.2